jgi:hypothetical protein
MKLTGAQAVSIRLMTDGNNRLGFSVYQGFSEAYTREQPTLLVDEAGVNGKKQKHCLEFSSRPFADHGG